MSAIERSGFDGRAIRHFVIEKQTEKRRACLYELQNIYFVFPRHMLTFMIIFIITKLIEVGVDPNDRSNLTKQLTYFKTH